MGHVTVWIDEDWRLESGCPCRLMSMSVSRSRLRYVQVVDMRRRPLVIGAGVR